MTWLLPAADIAREVGRARSTVRRWVHERRLHPAAVGPNGAHLFDLADAFEAERTARLQREHALRHGRGARRVAPTPEVRTRSWSGSAKPSEDHLRPPTMIKKSSKVTPS